MTTDTVKPNDPGQGPGFSSEQAIALRGETAALAQAEQLKAQVQARYLMALRQPRDWDTVRVRLLKECARPGFAEVARYHKPIGKGVEGLSIRFAEAAVRCMTNVLAESSVVYEDDEKRQIRVTVTDLEANVTYPIDVMVSKYVERSKVPDGEQAIRVRMNSYNKPVYTVRATEDDLLNKQNAQVSKAIRTAALRLLPGDIQDECEAAILETLAKRDKEDPEAAKKRVLDGFARLGILPTDVRLYIGKPLEQLVESDLAELRALYTALKDGEATWAAALEVKGRKAPEKAAAEGGAAQAGGTALDKAAAAAAGVKEQLDLLPACAACKKPITKPSDAIEVDGAFVHGACQRKAGK
jgi:hypothetical protein